MHDTRQLATAETGVTLVVKGLSKTYATGVHALRDLSLTVRPGLFGLLGPNGAGKSTLMRTIATLQRPDSGEIHFRDVDALREPARLRALLGYLPQEFGLYPSMPAETILDHFALLKGVTNAVSRRELVHRLLQQVNLYEVRHSAVSGFSGGMRQRLGIAIALSGSPALLIVDEPTAGLDPEERNRFLNLLADVGDEVVVILSTHIVEDVRDICSEIAIINRGSVVLHGTPSRVLDDVRGHIWRKRVPRAHTNAMYEQYNVLSVRLSAGQSLVHVFSDTDPGNGFELIEPDLEDVYFHRLG